MSKTDFLIETSINSENCFCSKLVNNSNEPITSFVFCFSILAPVKAVENCFIHFSSGGYAELKPEKKFVLQPGEEWTFDSAPLVQHVNNGFQPYFWLESTSEHWILHFVSHCEDPDGCEF